MTPFSPSAFPFARFILLHLFISITLKICPAGTGDELNVISGEIIMGNFIELFGEKVYLKSWREKLADVHQKHNQLGMSAREDFIRLCNRTPEEAAREHAELKAKHNARFRGSAERLAYYRSHGLDNCADYPGGDEAFERDVLAGDQREECMVFSFVLKTEDDYICKCLQSGHFVPETDFTHHFKLHPKIQAICRDVFWDLYGLTSSFHPDPAYDPWLPNSNYYHE